MKSAGSQVRPNRSFVAPGQQVVIAAAVSAAIAETAAATEPLLPYVELRDAGAEGHPDIYPDRVMVPTSPSG